MRCKLPIHAHTSHPGVQRFVCPPAMLLYVPASARFISCVSCDDILCRRVSSCVPSYCRASQPLNQQLFCRLAMPYNLTEMHRVEQFVPVALQDCQDPCVPVSRARQLVCWLLAAHTYIAIKCQRAPTSPTGSCRSSRWRCASSAYSHIVAFLGAQARNKSLHCAELSNCGQLVRIAEQ